MLLQAFLLKYRNKFASMIDAKQWSKCFVIMQGTSLILDFSEWSDLVIFCTALFWASKVESCLVAGLSPSESEDQNRFRHGKLNEDMDDSALISASFKLKFSFVLVL